MFERYMSLLPIVIIGALFTFTVVRMLLRRRKASRGEFIRSYMFPPGLLAKLGELHPQLSLKDRQLVARGLRQFFLAYLKSGFQYVAMPSQAVDDLWHAFILYTRDYEAFCEQSFGRFLHHTPAAALGPNRKSNAGVRRVWWYSCLEDNINPRKATRLPLLFALDEKLAIPHGFHYVLDCNGIRRSDSNSTIYCGSDMADNSFDGGTDGFGDNATDSSDAGSGDGGCGGGCGGGD